MARSIAHRGFTLIELMLVVAIIGLLAAIALPKFSNLVVKAREAATKGKLGAVRSALSLYYAENEGAYPRYGTWPNGMVGSLVPKYIDQVPLIYVPTAAEHSPGRQDSNYNIGSSPTDAWPGTWYAVEWDPATGITTGKIGVFCTHTDSKGTTWSLF